MSGADCLFCRIVRGEIPASKLYEDEDVLAFHDILFVMRKRIVEAEISCVPHVRASP